jgi:O-antigen/teichoic acid export membrane protein
MRKLLLIGINTLQGFANPAFNFLIVIFGVKIFGKENWGTLIEIMLWVFFSCFILGWGNRDYLLRAYSTNPGKMYDAFFSNLFSRSLLLPFTLLLFIFFPKDIAICSIILIILIFLYNSLSTLVIFHQKFRAQLITEIIGFGCVFGSIFYFKVFSLPLFLKLYIVVFFIKLLILSLQFKFWKEHFKISISLSEFKFGLPFFILGLSGWLVSKSDIYLVGLYLEKAQLSEYQLLITAFLMLQALAAYITIPFTKHIYRLPVNTIKKIKQKLYLISIPLTVLGGFSIWLIMTYFVKLSFGYIYYIIGATMALPCFFYTINIMELLKHHKENIVMAIGFFAFFVNSALILLLINSFEIFGVLISVCITQWVVLLCYKTHWLLNHKKQIK